MSRVKDWIMKQDFDYTKDNQTKEQYEYESRKEKWLNDIQKQN